MTFTNIPFKPSFEEFGKKIGLEKYKTIEDDISDLYSEGIARLKPKAICTVCYIDSIEGERVKIGSEVFTSGLLRANLESIERVFCYIATCGTELDAYASQTDDIMADFIFDELKDMALNAALDFLEDYIKRTYKVTHIASMNPGSADAHVWPIEQQEQLFSLLGDVEGMIGVQLTDSFLMTPNKTVSGIFFPSEVDFEMCEVCTRENCINRRAPYKK